MKNNFKLFLSAIIFLVSFFIVSKSIVNAATCATFCGTGFSGVCSIPILPPAVPTLTAAQRTLGNWPASFPSSYCENRLAPTPGNRICYFNFTETASTSANPIEECAPPKVCRCYKTVGCGSDLTQCLSRCSSTGCAAETPAKTPIQSNNTVKITFVAEFTTPTTEAFDCNAWCATNAPGKANIACGYELKQPAPAGYPTTFPQYYCNPTSTTTGTGTFNCYNGLVQVTMPPGKTCATNLTPAPAGYNACRCWNAPRCGTSNAECTQNCSATGCALTPTTTCAASCGTGLSAVCGAPIMPPAVPTLTAAQRTQGSWPTSFPNSWCEPRVEGTPGTRRCIWNVSEKTPTAADNCAGTAASPKVCRCYKTTNNCGTDLTQCLANCSATTGCALVPTITPSVTPSPTPTGPTATPRPTTPPGQATPTLPPGGSTSLFLKINFFGIIKQPNNEMQPVNIKIVKVAPLAESTNTVIFDKTIMFNPAISGNSASGDSFYYINNASMTETITIPRQPTNMDFALLIKGPKHLQRKINHVNLTVAGEKIIDLSGPDTVLLGGDLPLPANNNKQQGKVNSLDYAYLVNNFNSTDKDVLKVGDLNLDGVINAGDTAILANTLGEKLDEDVQ